MKKLLSIILAALLIAAAIPFAVSAKEVAQNYELGQTVNGKFETDKDEHTYNFSVDKTTKFTVDFSASIYYCHFYLRDNLGNNLYCGGGYDNTDGVVHASASMVIAKGDYSFVVFDPSFLHDDYSFTYTFNTTAEEVSDDLPEKQGGENNTLETAFIIETDVKYNTVFARGDVIESSGDIGQNNAKDVYKITLPHSGNLNFIFDGDLNYVTIGLYDASFNKIKTVSRYHGVNSNHKEINIDLNVGDYYFDLQAELNISPDRPDHLGLYSIETVFTQSDETLDEYQSGQNETRDTATVLYPAELNNGFMAQNEEHDWYKITLYEDSEYVFWSKSYCYYSIINVLNSEEESLASLGGYRGVTSGYKQKSYSDFLTAGDYYFKVSRDSEYTGTYELLCALLGDVDMDGEITIKDVTLIQKYLAKLETLEDYQITLGLTNADSDELTITCATNIQKYLAGINIKVSGKK